MDLLDLMTVFFKVTPELFCVLDQKGRILMSSQAFNNAFGFEGRDIRGHDYDDLVKENPQHASLFHRAKKWDAKAMEGGTAIRCEDIIPRPDGSDGLFEVTRTPLHSQDGALAGLVFSAQDITERVKREFDLQLVMAEQTAIFENAIIGILYTSGEHIHRVNRTLERMTGFSRSELEEAPADSLFEAPGAFARILAEAEPDLRQGLAFVTEHPARRKDGSLFQTRLSGLPIDSNDMGQGLIWCLDDIDEEKRIQRLREDTEMIVRHDLKAPLNGVIGFADLIRDTAEDDQTILFAGRIIDSGYQMLHMIDHSMDLFKMEEGTFVLDPKPLDLAALLRELDGEFNTLKRAMRVEIAYSVADGSSSCPISGSEPHLKSMFGNLIKNAIEASPEHGLVDVSILPGDPARVDIHNQGLVPEDVRDTFFSRYATSGKKSGTGLGTFSAKLIALAHRGDISFVSSEETGTILSVTLPKNPKP